MSKKKQFWTPFSPIEKSKANTTPTSSNPKKKLNLKPNLNPKSINKKKKKPFSKNLDSKRRNKNNFLKINLKSYSLPTNKNMGRFPPSPKWNKSPKSTQSCPNSAKNEMITLYTHIYIVIYKNKKEAYQNLLLFSVFIFPGISISPFISSISSCIFLNDAESWTFVLQFVD